ncbi:MAG: PilZ domain-containing protein [Anaerolineaceae bacterium]
MVEKRKYQRRHLIYYLRVFDRDTVNLIGHLVDITAEGVMVISENPIEVGKTFHMRMILPKEFFGKEQINFEAVSRWADKDINPSFYDTGFQLQDISEENIQIITQLIEDFGFND